MCPVNIPERYRKYAAGPLVTGCSNMKKQALSGHDVSEVHKEAVVTALLKGMPDFVSHKQKEH